MEGGDWGTEIENGSERGIQDEPLNLSASQLVQIMNCAMKRGHGSPPVHRVMNKKMKCIERSEIRTPFGIQSCSSPSLLSGKSRQELIQRNKYLERRVKELEKMESRAKELEILEQRVKELEKLNHMLQLGLVQCVRGTIIETLKSIIPPPKPVQPVCSPPIGMSTAYVTSQQALQQERLLSWSTSDEGFKNIVTSSSRSPDVYTDADVGGVVAMRRESFSSQDLPTPKESQDADSEQSLPLYPRLMPGQQALPIKQEPESDVADLPSSSPSEVVTTYGFPGALTRNTFQTCTTSIDNSCQNQMVTSSVPTIKVLGMANEIQQAVNESTNYKKLTNRLLNILFDREELACSTLTGKSKGERAKEKLDEDTVNLIIQQAVMRFPGTSPSDVRVVISQNCKDKALRFHKSNKHQPTSSILYPPTGLPPSIIFPSSAITWMETPIKHGLHAAINDNDQSSQLPTNEKML